MQQIQVQNNKGIILVDDESAEKLQNAKVYKQTRRDGKVSYAVKTPEMKKNETKGLTKFLFNRNFRQIKPGNDYRASNLKNLSSNYLCVYRNSTMGDYRFEFTHNNKLYNQGGFRRETDAAIAHDRLVQKLKLNRKLIILPNKDVYNAKVDELNAQNKQQEKQDNTQSESTQSNNIVIPGVLKAFKQNVISVISHLGQITSNQTSQTEIFNVANDIVLLSRILYYIDSNQFKEIESLVKQLNKNDDEVKTLKINFKTYVKGCI